MSRKKRMKNRNPVNDSTFEKLLEAMIKTPSTEELDDLIKTIMRAIKKSDRTAGWELIAEYRSVSDLDRRAIDRAFYWLCGYPLRAIITKQQNPDDPLEHYNPLINRDGEPLGLLKETILLTGSTEAD
jgi:hypothetical protein